MKQARCIELPYPGFGLAKTIVEQVGRVCSKRTDHAVQQNNTREFDMSYLSISAVSRAVNRACAAVTSLALAVGTMCLALPAHAAVPAAERQVLIDLYNGTAGDGWTTNTGWKTAGNFSAPGTECTWYGVRCDVAGNRVTRIIMSSNNLVGQLPATLNTLTALTDFSLYDNQLTGAIPSISGLTALEYFEVSVNQLSGPIPSLSGLSMLRTFYVGDNQLSGPIPDLAGLPALESLRVENNQLSGTPPAAPASLLPGGTALCPNFLHTPSPTDAAWDTARNGTWSSDCTPGYLVSSTAGSGGRIGPPQGVQAGQTATVVITPDPNFVIDTAFSTCGGSLAGNTFTTGPVNADCTVRASFRLAPGAIRPTVFVTPVDGGDARCTPEMPEASSTCTATPAPGFRLLRIEGCGGTPGSTSPYTTAPMTGTCMVSVTFQAVTPAVQPGPVAVPTLGEWAVIALGLLLGGLGVRRLRVKRLERM
ncbi:leucine-rich repeat domain-containing protein [Ottowia thiooxydans]|uniref:IPTL-CTERM protein sorting domain-containing protein n=1 Tax=Ottowia thiooxydans TaxID=219182 RepID=A0ABV2QG80_9BURK